MHAKPLPPNCETLGPPFDLLFEVFPLIVTWRRRWCSYRPLPHTHSPFTVYMFPFPIKLCPPRAASASFPDTQAGGTGSGSDWNLVCSFLHCLACALFETLWVNPNVGLVSGIYLGFVTGLGGTRFSTLCPPLCVEVCVFINTHSLRLTNLVTCDQTWDMTKGVIICPKISKN